MTRFKRQCEEPQKFRHLILAKIRENLRFICQIRGCQSNNALEGIYTQRVEEWQGTVSALIETLWKGPIAYEGTRRLRSPQPWV